MSRSHRNTLSTLRPGWGLFGAALVLCVCGTDLAAQGPTPAGTQISNVAEATYLAENGLTFTARSNVLVVTVAQVGGVDLAPPRAATANPGSRVVFAHTVTNVGNGTDSLRLSAVSQTGWVVTLYRDLNADGVLDASDPTVQGPITLAAGAVAALLAAVDVPGSATVRGTTDTVTVTAVSEFDGASDAVLDELQIPDAGVLVTLAKLVDRTTATTGDVLTYTLTYDLTGTNPATTLVVTDPIPLGATYVAGSLTWGGSALTDAAGDDAAWFDPAGNRVVFALGDIPSGQHGTLALQVRIDNGVADATPIANRAGALYGTPAGTDSVTSNTAVTTVVHAQLGIAKTLVGPATAHIGEQVSYTLVAANRSPTMPARAVTLSDTLPAGLEFVSASPAATVSGAVVSWAMGDLAAGDSVSVALTVRVSDQIRDTATVSNLAVVTSANALPQSAASAPVALVGFLPNQLGLQKSADVLEVGLGETVPYTLVLENTGDNALSDLRAVDSLPDGGRYANGSALGADSVHVDGRVLTFFWSGPLAAGATHTVHYQVAIISADQQVIENRAYATAEGGFVTAGMQVAWVRLRKSWPLETRAVIGKVWLDLNDDGVQSGDEAGVGGLDVWTDDGEVATTDADGKFSFQNVRAGGHAFRLDPTTVPADYRIATSDQIVALDAGGWTTPIVQFRLVPRAARVQAARVPLAWSFAARALAPVADTSPKPSAEPAVAVRPETVTADVPAVPIWVLPVNFEAGRARLTTASRPVLDELAALLNANAEIRVEIAGHTSSEGPRSLNVRLARERATTVTDYLVAQGVDAARLTAESYGPDRPVASNDTPEGRARNRRVEMRIVPGASQTTTAVFVRGVDSVLPAVPAQPVSAAPPAPPVTEYAVTIANPGDKPLEGLAVRFGTAVDSVRLLVGDTRLPVGTGPLSLPPVAPGTKLALTAWTTGAADSAVATLEIAGQSAGQIATAVVDSLTAIAAVASVELETTDLPSASWAADGHPVTVTLAPPAAGWPELTLALPEAWQPVAGSVRLAGAPAADPVVRTDPHGGRFLYWNFGTAAPGPVTLALAPVAAQVVAEPVSVPTLRAEADRDADARKAFLFGPAVRIFGLVDGTVTARDRVFIGARGEAGQPVTLYDGDTVLARGDVRVDGIYDFVAVPLTTGPHRLRVALRNTWNQDRWDSIAVHVSGPSATLVGPTGTLRLTADGQTIAPVRVRLLDRWGVPVVTPTHVTVTVDGAEVLGNDSDPSSVGLQLQSDSLGWLTVDVKPGFQVTRGRLTLQTGDAKYERPLETLPAARPLMVTAVGRVGVGAAPDAYGAVTARGRLDERTSVVLSVDSRRLNADRENFGRDYDPLAEAQYPILADASSVRTLSSSRYAVSARVERGFDWLAVGDVATGDFAQGLSLTTYRRALSGGMAQITTGPVAWRGFASVTSQSLQQEQIRGAGISGPYALGGAAIPTSEQIVVETRDRENPQRVVTRQALVRFVDYQIDYETGTLLFKRPVPAADASENPVFLVVTYEGRGGGDDRLVGGLRASVNTLPRNGLGLGLDSLRLGVSAIHADEATGAFNLTGVDVRLLKTKALDLGGELSYSHTPDSSGVATSLTGSADLLQGALHLSAAWMRIGDGFGNPSNIALRAGTEEFKAGGSYRLGTTGTTIRAQHEYFGSTAQAVNRRRTSLGVVQPIGPHFQVEATDAIDSFESGTNGDRTHALEGKLSWTPFPRLKLWAEGRQQLSSTESLVRPNQIGAGAGWKLTDKLSLELRQRFALLPDDQSYSVTNVGLRSELGFGTQAWGSYQLAGGAGARYNAAVIGLNNRLRFGSAWTVNTMFERRFGVNGADPGDPVRALPFLQDEEDYWSVGGGLEFLPQGAPYRVTGRGEYRNGDRLSTRLVTLAGDVSLNRSLAILSRQELLRTEQTLPTGARNSRRTASLWGVAFRPIKSDAVHVLTKFSWLDETNPLDRGVLTSLGQEQRLIGAAELIWTPTRRLELAGRYAIRQTAADRQLEDSTMQRLESKADYAGARAELRLNAFLTFRSEGRLLIERTSGSARWDVAPSLAVGLVNVLEVAAGYRFGDLRDPDFAVRGGHGAFVTLGARITEGSFATVADFWRSRFADR
jgi:uncharacterized repeat protein (TIGR01451 family)